MLRKTLHLSVKNTPIHSKQHAHPRLFNGSSPPSVETPNEASTGEGVQLVAFGTPTDLTEGDVGGGGSGEDRGRDGETR